MLPNPLTQHGPLFLAAAKLKSVEPYNKDGRKGTIVVYSFKDINDLKYSPDGSSLNMGGGDDGLEAEAAEKPLQFSYKDDTLTLINKDEKKEGPEDPADDDKEEMGDQELAMAKQMLGDMRISLKLNFPGGLAKTNASHVDGNKATIMDIQVGKILEQPEKFKELNRAEPETPAEMLKIL